MESELRGGLSFGLSGFSFWSHDVGGFVSRASDDLYLRWLAFGASLATFLLIVGWVAYSYWVESQSIRAVAGGVLFILALFLCVVLHEYGHALTARKYGIKTRDITLYPIGGVARLERMPEKPDAFFVRPDDVAGTVLAIVRQPPSAWAFEVEARPFGERW